jgi:flavin reductase (DIM6/NTAB) family NADH-FMN oxidoreductase RutF
MAQAAYDHTVNRNLAENFRHAMRRFAATVTIISAADQAGQRHGMTATAVTSLSASPPSLLACVNRSGALHDLIQKSETFCINVLHQDQAELSQVFSRAISSEERFTHGHWSVHAKGLPFLQEAQANIFCKKMLAVSCETHTIFIGEAFDTILRSEIAPLVYSDGNYAKCSNLTPPKD